VRPRQKCLFTGVIFSDHDDVVLLWYFVRVKILLFFACECLMGVLGWVTDMHGCACAWGGGWRGGRGLEFGKRAASIVVFFFWRMGGWVNGIIRCFDGLDWAGALGSAFCRGAIIDLLAGVFYRGNSFFDVSYETVGMNRCRLRGNFVWMGHHIVK